MRAVRIHKFGGGPQDLVYEEDVMQPHPKEGEILVKVYATGVTRNEIVWIWYNPDISLPLILGHEFSGIVEEVGPKVTNQRVSEAVYGLTDTLSLTRNGAEADNVIATDSEIAPKPQSLDHEYAAAVPMAGLTAWQALFDHAHLSSKDTVLIHGAAGGVGSFAVQLARWTGAHVIGTASAHNSSFLKDLGVNDVIDYKKTSFEDRVHDVDIVFDTVGGKILERSWQVLRKGGKLVSVASQDLPTTFDNLQAYFKEKGESYGIDATWFIVHPSRDQLIRIGDLIDSGQVKPVVDTILPLSQASQAYEGANGVHKHGKIVLRVR
ncbi:MAG: NADP-dependent oxidoreductase [Nitrososphaeraceae archaeon]|nr:NADP-dependent oxidoreductase [Nitrososphaeraceae archaeon]MDW0333104.1 NADP-dependent oxidoreductase [Nitrososphaeraceae archaeon]